MLVRLPAVLAKRLGAKFRVFLPGHVRLDRLTQDPVRSSMASLRQGLESLFHQWIHLEADGGEARAQRHRQACNRV
jgi:hypothetical protein